MLKKEKAPQKILILLALFVLIGLLQLATQSWFSGGLQLLATWLVWRGNETAIRLVIGYSVVSLVFTTIVTALAWATAPLHPVVVVWNGIQIGICAFSFWVLTRPEVKQWSAQKSVPTWDDPA